MQRYTFITYSFPLTSLSVIEYPKSESFCGTVNSLTRFAVSTLNALTTVDKCSVETRKITPNNEYIIGVNYFGKFWRYE